MDETDTQPTQTINSKHLEQYGVTVLLGSGFKSKNADGQTLHPSSRAFNTYSYSNYCTVMSIKDKIPSINEPGIVVGAVLWLIPLFVMWGGVYLDNIGLMQIGAFLFLARALLYYSNM